MNKKPVEGKPHLKWWLIGAAVLLLAGSTWAVTAMVKHRKSALPKDLTAEALKTDSAKDPHQVFERVHEAMSKGNLSEEQRHQVWENAREAMEARMDERIDTYFAAKTDLEKQAVLDRDLDEMQAHMKEWQQRRAQWQQQRAAQGGSGGSAGRPSAGPGGGGPGGGPGPAGGPSVSGGGDRRGGPGGHQHSRQERKTRSESRDPNKRAQRMAYFTAMGQRAQQRGLSMPFGGGGPRGER